MIHYTFNTHRSEVKCLFISFDFYLSGGTRMHFVLNIYLNNCSYCNYVVQSFSKKSKSKAK